MKKALLIRRCACFLVLFAPVLVLAVTQTQTTGWVQGKVVSIDKSRLHLTIKHAKIPSIGMDAMTMPFKVKSLDLLNKVHVGDRVRFDLVVDDGTLELVRMERVK